MNETINYVLLLIILLLPLYAQSKIKRSYKKYMKTNNTLNLTGKDVAKKILDNNGLTNVKIYDISGTLTDHYDPSKKTIKLSNHIYSNTSIASIAVAAHECGHAIQDKEAYSFLRFRSKMVPVVNITSKLSSVILIIGIFLGALDFINIALLLLTIGLLFQIVTLPVEFNASKRAKEELVKCGFIENKDKKGIEKMLSAAAFTYVAAFLSTALQILRLFMSTRRRN